MGEIDDDLVTVAVGGSPGRAFRQIEFELDESEKPHADPVVIEKMLTAMKKAGAHIELEQKFAKALGIDANDRNLCNEDRSEVHARSSWCKPPYGANSSDSSIST